MQYILKPATMQEFMFFTDWSSKPHYSLYLFLHLQGIVAYKNRQENTKVSLFKDQINNLYPQSGKHENNVRLWNQGTFSVLYADGQSID